MWVFQGTSRHCALKCCWNPSLREVGAWLPLPSLRSSNLYDQGDHMWHTCIRWLLLMWVHYCFVLFSPWKWGGRGGSYKHLSTLSTAVLRWWCINEGFFYSFHQVISKCSSEGQYFFSFHSSISWILILGAHFLILLELCPLSLFSSASYFFLSAIFFF